MAKYYDKTGAHEAATKDNINNVNFVLHQDGNVMMSWDFNMMFNGELQSYRLSAELTTQEKLDFWNYFKNKILSTSDDHFGP